MASSIGVLREGPLHASLKELYREPGDQVEARLGGYVVDLLRGDLVIEIQTSSFTSIRRKLRDLVQEHRVRLVYPIPKERWIVKLPGRGEERARRKSPRKVGFEELFQELVSFPDLIAHPNFELEAVTVREEEVRRRDRRRGRRRGGWVVVERRLVEVVDRLRLSAPDDLAVFLPDELPDPFRTSDLSSTLRRPRYVAQRAAYCMRKCGLIEAVGKERNTILYRRA